MNLEVGMYVRFNGMINKIIGIDDNWYDDWLDEVSSMDIDIFIKDYKPIASFNIIDLIEVGDYVNGMKVLEIEEGCTFIDGTISNILWTDTIKNNAIWNETIKSIVTKEQFENMSYHI